MRETNHCVDDNRILIDYGQSTEKRQFTKEFLFQGS